MSLQKVECKQKAYGDGKSTLLDMVSFSTTNFMSLMSLVKPSSIPTKLHLPELSSRSLTCQNCLPKQLLDASPPTSLSKHWSECTA